MRIEDLFWKLRVLRAWMKHRNLAQARIVTRNGLDAEPVSFSHGSRTLLLKRLGIEIALPEHEFMLEGYSLARGLIESGCASFTPTENEGIRIHLPGMSAFVESIDDLWIIHDLFIDGVYNLVYRTPAVFIDVGLNAGLASLFFARQPGVIVYGFEPFQTIYQRALRNFALNPHLSQRINPLNFGVGSSDGMVPARFSVVHPARGGMFPEKVPHDRAEEFREEQIILRNACVLVQDILSKHNHMPLIAKIDCEGSEYAILRSLSEGRLLNRFAAIIMEWHRREEDQDPRELCGILSEAGFGVVFLQPLARDHGMLYGFNLSQEGQWLRQAPQR